MRIVFWLESGLASLMVAVSLPLFLDLLLVSAGSFWSSMRTRVHQSGPTLNRPHSRLAIVIPAHDEQSLIARTIRSVQAADAQGSNRAEHAPSTIYVVAHNCTDQTAQVAEHCAATVVKLDSPGGKPAALRAGFARALSDGCQAVLILDADSVVSLNLIQAVQAALAAGASAAQCRYEQRWPLDSEPTLAQRLRVLAFRGMNVVRGRGRAALGFSAGIFGNGFVLTAETLRQVPYRANTIAEDIEYHAALVASGRSVAWIEQAQVIAELAPTGEARKTQQARWEGGRLRVALSAAPRLIRPSLRGSRSSIEAFLAVASLPFSLAILAVLLCLALPLPWVRLYGLTALAIACFYLAMAVHSGPNPRRDWLALLAAPNFLFQKIALIPRIARQAGSKALWTRTARENSPSLPAKPDQISNHKHNQKP